MATIRNQDLPQLSDVFERINIQDRHLTKLTTVVEGHVEVLGDMKRILDDLKNAVIERSAREPLDFFKIMGGAALLLGVGGSLGGLIIVFVSSVYDSRLAANAERMEKLETAIVVRDTEDRAELIRLRDAERLTFGSRIRALEEEQGWAPTIGR